MKPSMTAQLAQWIRELDELPETPEAISAKVCQPLSKLLGGAEVSLELSSVLRAGVPSFSELIRLDAGAPTWMPRCIQQEGGLVFWVQWGGTLGASGWIAFSLPNGASKKVGTPVFESLLLIVASHLRYLVERRHLQTQIASREQFLAIASHELKTPLTAIYGLAQLQERMLRQAPLPTEPEALRTEQERQWSFSKRMVRQLERMTELIEGLLALSRIRAGRFSVEPIPVDAARAVRELQDQRLSILANEAGVELLVELPERLPAKLDPLRFDEVVTNLVMQGIRRSPEGGLVRLELAPVNHTLRLRVSDQGVPIPRSEWDSSFEPFMSREGLGLGLYVSRQIARLHQGEVRFLEPEGPRGNRLEATFLNPISQAA